MNILISPDNKVIASTCTLLNSLRLNHPDQRIVVYILWCDLSKENLKSLEDFGSGLGMEIEAIKLDLLPINRLFSRLSSNRLTASCLLRCFAGQALPESVERVLYLDTDIVLAGSIEALYTTRLGHNIAGAVLNPGMKHLEKYGVCESSYFNSGVLLIDMKKWREQHLDSKLQSFIAEHSNDCRFWDQCALNVVLLGNTLSLDNRWNVMSCLKEDGEFTNVSIIHFAGDVKPWENPESHPFGIHYCNYSRGTPWPMHYRYKLLRHESPAIFRARSILKKNAKKFRDVLGWHAEKTTLAASKAND
ncbi:MAG: glycosyltransferase family 8 protein [Rhizobiaceae bacterium]|nr:glycosyltransferase family 8 protein [Rhizobiaceae bacterium]